MAKKNSKKKKDNGVKIVVIIVVVLIILVIGIIGLIMASGIKTTTNTMDNLRVDSFIALTDQYANGVQNATILSELKCKTEKSDSFDTLAENVPDGNYYIYLDSTKEDTLDLLESGGKSPFGNNDVSGYVKWKVVEHNSIDYMISLVDIDGHGVDKFMPKGEIKRADVKTEGATLPEEPTDYECIYSY